MTTEHTEKLTAILKNTQRTLEKYAESLDSGQEKEMYKTASESQFQIDVDEVKRMAGV